MTKITPYPYTPDPRKDRSKMIKPLPGAPAGGYPLTPSPVGDSEGRETDSKPSVDLSPEAEFYICDLRPEWRKKWAITFWRPENAGYAFPLCWAGKYDSKTVTDGGQYYFKNEGRAMIRFPVLCAVAEELGVAPPPRQIDGDAGPVVLNTGANRIKLRKAGRAAIAALTAWRSQE